MNKNLILAVVMVIFFFGAKPAAKWLHLLNDENSEQGKTEQTIESQKKPPTHHETFVFLPEMTPQDNTLEKANQYTDFKVGEVQKDLNNFKVETDGNFKRTNEKIDNGFKSMGDLIRGQTEKPVKITYDCDTPKDESDPFAPP